MLAKLDFVIDTTAHYVAQEEFAHFMQHLRDSSGTPVFPVPRKWPICDEQQYIFSINEAIPSIPMKVSWAMEFSQRYSPEALSDAVEKCIQTADVFGARIVMDGARPTMAFLPYQKRAIPVLDFATTEEYETYCRTVKATEINNRDKLYYLFIYSVAGSCYHIHFCFNHIIFDAISGLIVSEKIRTVLLDATEEIKWHPFATYLDKIKQYNESEQYHRDQVFWEDRFSQLSQSEYLFADVIDMDAAPIRNLAFQTSHAFKTELFEYCAENKFSPHLLIVAVLAQTINARAGLKRFYFEIPIGNRSGADEKNSIGPYVKRKRNER